MSLFRRVILSIFRNRLKTFLLFMILFILGNLIAGAIAIRQGTQNVEDRIKQSLGAVVRVGIDQELYFKLFEESDPEKSVTYEHVSPSGNSTMTEVVLDVEPLPTLSAKDIAEIAQSNRVKSYDYNTTTKTGSPHLLSVDDSSSVAEKENLFGINLFGIQYAPVMAIEEGSAELVDGRVFKPEEIEQGDLVCLIGKELADRNQIRVGDTLVLTKHAALFNQKDFIVDSFDVSLQVIGIYQERGIQSLEFGGMYGHQDNEAYEVNQRINTLIVPNQVVLDILEGSKEILVNFGLPEGYSKSQLDGKIENISFALKSTDDVTPFLEEYEASIPRGSLFYTNHNIYNDIAAPVEQAKKMADSVLFFSIGATILIAGLTVLLFLRDRKQELGILMSLGETKQKVVTQIVLEVLLIALLATILSLFTGQAIATRLSDSMIEDQLVAEVNYQDDIDFWRNRSAMGQFAAYISPEEAAKQYEIRFTPAFIITFLVLSWLTILVSTILPTLYIVNLKPKKVLMN